MAASLAATVRTLANVEPLTEELRPGGDEVSEYAAPARAADLSRLPAAYLSTCEFDPLRDEGLLYAHRLIQAGVPTELRHYPGTFHGSEMVGEAAVSRRMHAEMLDALRRGFESEPLTEKRRCR